MKLEKLFEGAINILRSKMLKATFEEKIVITVKIINLRIQGFIDYPCISRGLLPYHMHKLERNNNG